LNDISVFTKLQTATITRFFHSASYKMDKSKANAVLAVFLIKNLLF